MPMGIRLFGVDAGRDHGDPPSLRRRTLLKLAGAAAAIASAGTVAGALIEDRDGAAPHGTSGVSLGGAPIRPPSVPLAVRTPYLSVWLPATDLASATAQFWTGADRGFTGLARIDGAVYAWAGQPEVNGTVPRAMSQTSLEVTATRSIFTLRAGGVELVAEWLSPVEPGDLTLQSVPLSLLTVAVGAIDASDHSVQVYAEITGEWASSDKSAIIEWETSGDAQTRYWAFQLKDQQPLREDLQMAQWGTAIWATPHAASETYQSGYAVALRDRFASTGELADSSDPRFRAIGDDQPAFAFARDLGRVGGSRSLVYFAVGHVRSPALSYGRHRTPLISLWTRYWPDWQSMTGDFLADASAARRRAIMLDATIEDAATRQAGPGYSAMCALAVRQCYGGTELVIGPQGSLWLMVKEISSDGDVNTVDIFDQAFLLWLWLDPARIPLVMEPILDWCSSPAWQGQAAWKGIPAWEQTRTRYCVHDLGVYPVAWGRTPGDGEQMPIEESAGMLIMAAAYARKAGAAMARPFLSRYHMLWTQWAEYLLTQVPTPATQLTTDDYVREYRRPTGSVNLGIKAIIGLAAASQVATVVGDSASAAKWSKAAADQVPTWVARSTDPSGRYLNLEQGAAGTWCTLYNAFYEQVIGTRLVPEHVAAMQARFYLRKQTTFGMPLQTGCHRFTKVAWLTFISGWLSNYPISGELLDRDAAYISGTPSRVPYGDRYNPVTGVESTARAHPTIGAVFALLAAAQ
jgi:hypothetical protein